MKFTEKTIAVLQNFAAINPSILFLKGKTQRTIYPSMTFAASATLDDDFPLEVGLYNLVPFLSILSLFKTEADVEFTDRYVEIKKGASVARFSYSEPKLIKHPPKDKEIAVQADVTFELKQETLAALLKGASILSAPHFIITGDGTDILMTVKDMKNETSNSLTEKVGKTTETFSVLLENTALRLMSHNYDVIVDKRGLVKFMSKDMQLTYVVSKHIPKK
jgi:hypothetical protein